jgi:asparagine synthase (glutamine-hydrolysing)
MCGVLVIFSKKEKLNKKKCEEALRSLKNRGPDKILKEYFLNDRLFIANTILSIIGDIKKGGGLYTSKSKRFKVTYNGEIYNFNSLSKKFILKNNIKNDTDLLVNLFDHCKYTILPKLLDGMYAYCVYDEKNKYLYIASDPQGEKKIYHYTDDNFTIFSSTIIPILKFISKNKIKINYNTLKDYFDRRHFLNSENTFYEKIKYLKPGHTYLYKIKKNIFTNICFDNPINWISKKRYQSLKNKSQKEMEKYFKNIIYKVAKKMTPAINFGSLMSGGIDSSIQSKIVSTSNYFKRMIFIDHGIKDPISKNITNFNFFFKKKINTFKMTNKIYFNLLRKIYSSLKMPFFTHDLPGRYSCFKFFKKNNIKVAFAADGVDELFGGYELYKNLYNNRNQNFLSSYSNFENNYSSKNGYEKKNILDTWNKAFKRYKTFMNIKEARIQASLYVDYFVQSVGVHNITNDFLAGENSLEIRNVFLNKNIIKNAINLPIKYKINLKNQSLFILKPLLKKIFINLFSLNLIYKKQGFSGFPNESAFFLSKKEKINLKNIKNKFLKKRKIDKALEWKIINLFYYNKFNNKKINYQKILN